MAEVKLLLEMPGVRNGDQGCFILYVGFSSRQKRINSCSKDAERQRIRRTIARRFHQEAILPLGDELYVILYYGTTEVGYRLAHSIIIVEERR